MRGTTERLDMSEQEYVKVTIIVESSNETLTYEMGRVAGAYFEFELEEPEIDSDALYRKVVVPYKAPVLRWLNFRFKPVEVDGKHMTIKSKRKDDSESKLDTP